jgi:hypothetical protein
MQWEPWGKYSMRTTSKRWAISKAHLGERVIYTLWWLPNKRIDDFATFEAAKLEAQTQEAMQA